MVTALVRETREEAGIVVDPADVRAAVTVHHRSPAGGARLGVFFEVKRWQGIPEVMEHRVCDAMEWFALDNLPEPMVAYCRAGLDAYRVGARMAVHFQEPGDLIAYDPDAERREQVGDVGFDGSGRVGQPVGRGLVECGHVRAGEVLVGVGRRVWYEFDVRRLAGGLAM
ncbi:NUDIX domain-containing protein [Streptomyces sp. NPDC047841]|uniref:NUDIX domain-containing protein n=1 Tax=Streptomyces sp. NPDC047841 TaxID=3154708 RepID=UPI0034538E5E